MDGIALSLILTKLRTPPLSKDLVARPHLLACLNAGIPRPLTLLSAPAGFGKTSLLSQWLEQCPLPSAWLSLDEGDADLAVFLSYVLAAIQTLFPHACAKTFDLLRAPELPPVRVLAANLINDLDGLPQRCVLVLDDYHLAQSKSVGELLDHLVRYPPRPLHLALATRQDPLLPLAVLRGRNQLTELRLPQLRFSLDEMHAYLRSRLGVAQADNLSSIIEQQTEGWPVGVGLAALSVEGVDNARGLLAQMPSGGPFVVDYLVEEVLARQSPATQDFLVKTSILERFCAGLCDAVLGTSASQAQLAELERLNLFIVGLDGRHEWYRYHHLFRDLLRHHLRAGDPSIAELHRRASAWFAAHGWVDEAIDHALAADEPQVAGHLVERHWIEAMNNEDFSRVDRWLHRLPLQIIQTSPHLLMARVWVLQQHLNLTEIRRHIDQVDALLDEGTNHLSEPEIQGLRAEVAMFRSQDYYWQADAQRSIVCARQAIAFARPAHSNLVGSAYVYLSGSLQMAGNLADAYAELYDGLAKAQNHTNNYIVRVLMGLCAVTWMAGDLAHLAEAGKRLLSAARGRPYDESAGWAQLWLGCMHYQRHELAAAEEHFRALGQRVYLANQRCALHGMFGLALTQQAQAQPDEARRSANAASSFALELGQAGLVSEADAFRAHLALLQGDLVSATHWAEHFGGRYPLLPMPFFEIPHLTLAQVLLAQQTTASLVAAGELLERLDVFVERTHNTCRRIDVWALKTLLCQAQGERAAALEALAVALRLAEPGGFIRVFLDLGAPMIDLLRQLTSEGHPSAHLQRILTAAAIPASQTETTATPLLTSPVTPSPRLTPLKPPELIDTLTFRELDVLALLAQRLSDKEIANLLFISVPTVKKHTAHIYQKLHVSGRREAILRAKALELIP